MSLDRYSDVAVIGGGIAGMGVAANLAKNGKRVRLFDTTSAIPYHSSSRAASLWAESYASCPEFTALTQASRKWFTAPPTGFTNVTLSSPMPALYVAGRHEVVALAELYRSAHINGAAVEWLETDDDVLKHVPIFRPEYPIVALMEPNAMLMDIAALHEGYRRMLLEHQGQIILDAEVLGAWVDCTTLNAIETKQGMFYAELIVDASGAWGDVVGARLGGTHIGIEARRRTVLISDYASVNVDRATLDRMPFVFTAGGDLYFRPEAGRVLISPADETLSVPRDEQPEIEDVARAIYRFEEITTAKLAPRPVKTWAGIRPFAPDERPVVGFDPAREGLFRLLGHGGYGIQTAPAMSRLAAALILEGRVPDDLAQLGITAERISPNRFAQQKPALVAV